MSVLTLVTALLVPAALAAAVLMTSRLAAHRRARRAALSTLAGLLPVPYLLAPRGPSPSRRRGVWQLQVGELIVGARGDGQVAVGLFPGNLLPMPVPAASRALAEGVRAFLETYPTSAYDRPRPALVSALMPADVTPAPAGSAAAGSPALAGRPLYLAA